jgi:hypothetical protein
MALMMETIANEGCPADTSELASWFARAHDPWNPITAAERQLDALIGNTNTAPALAAYDHLYELANQAVQWLELNSCPDRETGRRIKAQMIVYGIVADTMRSTFVATEADSMLALLVDLRELIDQHADALGL